MTNSTPPFDVDGFDSEALTTIEPRRTHVCAFIRQVAEGCLDPALLATAEDSALRREFQKIESSVELSQYYTLAEQLDFPHTILQRTLSRIWRSEMLNRQIWEPPQRVPAELRSQVLDDIVHKISGILATSEDVEVWISVFQAQHLFRDDDSAKQAAHQLGRVRTFAAGMARDLVLGWCNHDTVALLRHSNYPCFTELMLLQERATGIAENPANSQALMPTLRADVIALRRAFHHPDFLKAYRVRYGHDACPWDQSLLHQPAQSDHRKRCRERLEPFLPQLISLTAQERCCEQTVAGQLVEIVLASGLDDLIHWRSDNTTHEVQLFHDQQIQRRAERLLRAFPESSKQQILNRLQHLQDAIHATKAYFPLPNLISHLPSSRYRRKRQRRKIPQQLIQEFATRANISPEEAKSCIKNLMIYGPLGMLPKKGWNKAIHPRLWSYLHMFKMGRLEDTVDASLLTERVNIYARSLNAGALPKQILLSVFSHFWKNDYYNSGDGPATAGVPLRKALKLAGVDRLHENWLLLQSELDIQLIDAGMHPIGKICSIVLVLDCGSQRPVGFWISETIPGNVEVGLALYDAIFHPGALHWPLRGIPEHILVPAELEERGIDNVRQAASFLMARVEVIPDREQRLAKLPFARKLIKDLMAEYTPARLPGRRRAPKVQMTIRQVEEASRKWLYQRCFGDEHRTDPVIKELRQHGVALPGYDTPAAGYLLPVITELITERDGVTINRRFYTDPTAGIEPGVPVRVRMAPARLGAIRGIFIEFGSKQVMHYLPLHMAAKKKKGW